MLKETAGYQRLRQPADRCGRQPRAFRQFAVSQEIGAGAERAQYLQAAFQRSVLADAIETAAGFRARCRLRGGCHVIPFCGNRSVSSATVTPTVSLMPAKKRPATGAAGLSI